MESIFGGSETFFRIAEDLVLFPCVQWLRLDSHSDHGLYCGDFVVNGIILGRGSKVVEVGMLEDAASGRMYSRAVGRFLGWYCSIDSMRSIASRLAAGMRSTRL